jgi:hypothetical protein
VIKSTGIDDDYLNWGATPNPEVFLNTTQVLTNKQHERYLNLITSFPPTATPQGNFFD